MPTIEQLNDAGGFGINQWTELHQQGVIKLKFKKES